MKKKFLAPALFLLLGMSMFAYSSSLSAEEKGQTEPTIRLTPGLSHFKALECDIPASIIYTQGDHFDLVIETPIQYEKLLRYNILFSYSVSFYDLLVLIEKQDIGTTPNILFFIT